MNSDKDRIVDTCTKDSIIKFKQMKLMLVIALLLVVLQAEIIPFDNSAIEKIFQQKKAALFLFIGDESTELLAQ